MIVSHEHRFIFLKTAKTAGTSIEIALSKYCSPDDTVTPIFVEDERTRAELGYQGPANYLIPYGQYSRLDWCQFVATRRRLKFLNHSPAAHVQQYVESDIWNSYFKFSVERNPWDKLVSYYYWEHRGTPTMPIDEWVRQGKGNRAVPSSAAVDPVSGTPLKCTTLKVSVIGPVISCVKSGG